MQGLSTQELDGCTVISTDGETLGEVSAVHTDEAGMPQYLEVRSGWFGMKRHAIPMAGLERRDDGTILVPYTKQQLTDAPMLDDDEDLTYERERSMGDYYGTGTRDWDDTRDGWIAEEDLTRGPTPETRHPHGGLDEVADLTQGPTPITRDVMRATDDDPAAAGQPMADPRTREGHLDHDHHHSHDDRAVTESMGRDVMPERRDNLATGGDAHAQADPMRERLRDESIRSEAERIRVRAWRRDTPGSGL